MARTETANDAAQNANADAANQGPPIDIPDVVPDFVSDLLDSISAGVTGLGERISDIAATADPAEIPVVAAEVVAALLV